MSTMPAGAVDLFVGQMIALLPKLTDDDIDDPVIRQQVAKIFPRALDDVPTVDKTPRPRTYPLYLNTQGGGILTVAGVEIPVAVLPLDVATPHEATVFKIAAIAGRSLRIQGIAEGVTPTD